MAIKLQRAEVEKSIGRNGDVYDVIVAGGGPAGIGAALASAMNGAKTLLLEARAFFGGVATVSGWMPMNRLMLQGKSRGRAMNAFVSKIQSMGEMASRPGKNSWVDGDGLQIHPDYLRLAALELLEENGCHYRLHSPVTGVEKEGNRVTAVICDGKYGKSVFYAKAFVDCTGDGDLAFHAGARAMMGREEDGMFMPVTLGFVVGSVDEKKLFDTLEKEGHAAFTDRIKRGAEDGYSVSIFYSFDKTTVPGMISVNNGGQRDLGVVNAINMVDLNLAERCGLQVAIDFVTICRERKIPGLEDCYLVRTGADLGIRETRRIEGDYVMTLEDAQNGVHFEDVVALRYGTIDPGGLVEDKGGIGASSYLHGTIKNGNEYPYRCMLPKGVEGVLVAGRCASLTHLGLTVCKSMGNMMAIGQSAGTAAAMAVQQAVTPRDLDVHVLQQRLGEMGVDLKL